MFSALAGAMVAMKIHFSQMTNNMTKRRDNQVSQCIYENKVNKQEEKEKYKKSKLPESGYMTTTEYEDKARAQTKKEINAKILDKADVPKDSDYVYVPQHKYKLVKYNNPVGSPELNLPRKLNFDRQINAQGIVSGDVTMLVYPSVYYYAQSDCTSCDLFLIKLDRSLTDLDKVQKANVLNKDTKPILSTDKSIDLNYVFRTLTPIDFSSDNKKLAIKEKIGYRHDGIWETRLWVYDFETERAIHLPQIRDAIIYYWKNEKDFDLSQKRWDIYPLGFDANDNNRVVVCAYAYTGDKPIFLGTWSIDTEGVESRLETMDDSYIPVAIVGFKLVEDSEVIPVSEVEAEAKKAKKAEKKQEKKEKAEKRFEKKQQKLEYKRKVEQMNMDTIMKIRERKKSLKEYKKNHKEYKDGFIGE